MNILSSLCEQMNTKTKQGQGGNKHKGKTPQTRVKRCLSKNHVSIVGEESTPY